MRHDAAGAALYRAWCDARREADRLFDTLDEKDARVSAAEQRARRTLAAFLDYRSASPHLIRLKLDIACECEDFYTDAADPACGAIAPRAVVAAVRDLEYLIRCTPDEED